MRGARIFSAGSSTSSISARYAMTTMAIIFRARSTRTAIIGVSLSLGGGSWPAAHERSACGHLAAGVGPLASSSLHPERAGIRDAQTLSPRRWSDKTERRFEAGPACIGDYTVRRAAFGEGTSNEGGSDAAAAVQWAALCRCG